MPGVVPKYDWGLRNAGGGADPARGVAWETAPSASHVHSFRWLDARKRTRLGDAPGQPGQGRSELHDRSPWLLLPGGARRSGATGSAPAQVHPGPVRPRVASPSRAAQSRLRTLLEYTTSSAAHQDPEDSSWKVRLGAFQGTLRAGQPSQSLEAECLLQFIEYVHRF
jgi:hypothetical protein